MALTRAATSWCGPVRTSCSVTARLSGFHSVTTVARVRVSQFSWAANFALLLQQASADPESRCAHSRLTFWVDYLTGCTLRRKMVIGDGEQSPGGTGDGSQNCPK